MNPLLKSIADNASADLAKLIEEGEGDILKAIHNSESEAQLQETTPKFKLSYSISIDLDHSKFTCDLSWSFKQTLSTNHAIEDPNQAPLPIEPEE